MKKIIFAAILIFVFICFACKNKERTGIFEFKLGMSESELRAVVDTSLLKMIDNSYFFDDYLRDRQKGFSLSHYEVDESYSIENIELLFFDDELSIIEINEYNSKTEELLTLKYGEPEIEIKKDPVVSAKTEWIINKNNLIKCYAEKTIYAGFKEDYYLTLFDNTMNARMHKEIDKLKKKQKKANQPLLDRL